MTKHDPEQTTRRPQPESSARGSLGRAGICAATGAVIFTVGHFVPYGRLHNESLWLMHFGPRWPLLALERLIPAIGLFVGVALLYRVPSRRMLILGAIAGIGISHAAIEIITMIVQAVDHKSSFTFSAGYYILTLGSMIVASSGFLAWEEHRSLDHAGPTDTL